MSPTQLLTTMKIVQMCLLASTLVVFVYGISFSELEPPLTADDENRIYGGWDADIDKVPFMTGIRANGSESENFCGGTLIAPQYVLTAAHCLEWYLYDVYASLGSRLKSGRNSMKSEAIRVVEAFRHPQYNLSKDLIQITHDVALLKLERPSDIKPAPLASEDGANNKPGSMATTYGWGLVSNNTISQTLRTVDVEIITNAECRKLFTDGTVVDKSVICAGHGHGKDACGGDSGGPLLADGVLVGIVSAGGEECGVLPGVYARVSYALDFIEDILAGGSTGNITERLTAGTSFIPKPVSS